jgi:UDP-N-acetylmuramoylalanine--D-glutamate ligase
MRADERMGYNAPMKRTVKNKATRFLLVGLGILGGGVATARFLAKRGALRVTDLRTKEVLKDSLASLPEGTKTTIGTHVESDFAWADVVVANPAVPRGGEWIRKAELMGKRIVTDFTLFLENIGRRDYVAITGTRGKTTTSLWVNALIPGSIVGGNIPGKGPLSLLRKKGEPFVLEMSSFQLEYVTRGLKAPRVAVITNLYVDHLNRHGTMEGYAAAKAGIFINQTVPDALILNADDEWASWFAAQEGGGRTYYISVKRLPRGDEGLFMNSGRFVFREEGTETILPMKPLQADFENHNLMAAALAAFLYRRMKRETSARIWKDIAQRIRHLPSAPMRREVIYKSRTREVVNDSAGTSPDATIALLSAYPKAKKAALVLIAGGTDKQLVYDEWARMVKKRVSVKNLYLLRGSATEKMVLALRAEGVDAGSRVYESLEDIVEDLESRKDVKLVLFSPGAASFEKFKNEFDRGRTFVRLAKRLHP